MIIFGRFQSFSLQNIFKMTFPKKSHFQLVFKKSFITRFGTKCHFRTFSKMSFSHVLRPKWCQNGKVVLTSHFDCQNDVKRIAKMMSKWQLKMNFFFSKWLFKMTFKITFHFEVIYIHFYHFEFILRSFIGIRTQSVETVHFPARELDVKG